MEQIQSAKNAFIKKVRSLKQKKYRDETGLFLAEGDKCAKEALQAGRAEALLTTKEDHQLAIQAEREGIRTVFVPRLVMETVCEIKSPQEVLAVAKKAALPLPREGLFVALENVSDPQNVGTILRTADAVGAAGVLLSGRCADYTSPKAVRAAMGSTFHLPIQTTDDFSACLLEFKQNGVFLVGGHLQGIAAPGLLKGGGSACVVIGNEARGMSKEASELCDCLVKIPIYGRAESLNAAVAAGILLYWCRQEMDFCAKR